MKFVDEARSIFPGLPVGSIEGVWVSTEAEDFAVWLDAYETRTGEPFAFIHVDPDWTRRDWPEVVRKIEKIADDRDVPFGLLYNGLVSQDEAEWLPLLAERVATYEDRFDGTPDHAVLQSWDPWPDRVLPTDDIAAFSHMIRRYLEPRLRFEEVTLGSDIAVGRIVSVSGEPAADLPVEGRMRPFDDRPQTVTATGVVPPGTTRAIGLIRANAEDATPGEADVLVHDLVFRVDDSENLIPNGSFDAGLNFWAPYTLVAGEAVPVETVTAVVDVVGPALRIRARADQPTYVDGPQFDVVAGERYSFSVTFGADVDTADTVTVAIGFVGAAAEFDRRTIFLAPSWQTVATDVTDFDGRFDLRATGSFDGFAEIEIATPGDLTRIPARVLFGVDGLDD